MNEIFTVWVRATHYRDENGWKEPLALEDSGWIDSYWTDENKAIEAAQKIWEDDAIDEFIEALVVFGRKLDVPGSGMNLWDSKRDRVIKRWA